MIQARKSRASRPEVFAIVLLLIGVSLIPLNFFYPVTTIQNRYEAITSLNEYSLYSKPFFNITAPELHPYSLNYLLNFTGLTYWYSSPLHLNQGQVFVIDWASGLDTFIGYIFSENQFNYFQSFYSSSLNSSKYVNPWNGSAFSFEAIGISARFGETSYKAAESGNYVCAITNTELYDGNEFDACPFDGKVVSTYNVTHLARESNNLCLYLGITFLVAGTISFLVVTVRHRKTTNLKQEKEKAKKT